MNKRKKSQGFGIIEVLISSSIIISVLGALVYAGRAAYQNSLYLQEKAEALGLAQEGIELTRQIRDTNWIDNDSNTHWNDLVMTGGVFSEVLPNLGQEYGIGQARLIDGTYRYGLTSGTNEKIKVNTDSTEFTRQIIIEDTGNMLVNSQNEKDTNLSEQAIKVTAKVVWGEKEVSISEIMTNWRPNY